MTHIILNKINLIKAKFKEWLHKPHNLPKREKVVQIQQIYLRKKQFK